MKKVGFNVVNVNLNHRDGTVVEILKELILENDIDVVATGGLSFQFNTVKLICDITKNINNTIITIVGGGLITGDPETAMEAVGSIDYGIIGEGETTMNELCFALEKNGDLFEVDGLVFEKNGSYFKTKSRKEIVDIYEIPWPDYESFEIEKYLKSSSPGISGLNGNNTIFMLLSRSCPYNCTFCFHTVGKKYRQRSFDRFFEELDYLTSKYSIDFVCMADELFARDIDRVKEFCTRIKQYNVRWWGQFRVGDIEETSETAYNTLKWWKDHIDYKISLNFITVYPGSYLYKYACEKGIIKDKVKFLKDGCSQINVSKISNLAKDIMEAPISTTKQLHAVELKHTDYKTGRINFNATCDNCGHVNSWENVKMFATNLITCDNCELKYNVPIPTVLVKNIEINTLKIIEKYGKIGFWAVNFNTSYLFKHARELQDERLHLFDISKMKTIMMLYGKKIENLENINDMNISVIIIMIPAFFSQISAQIDSKFKGVKRVIDICSLTNSDFMI